MEEKSLSILRDVTERVRYYARRSILDWLKLGEALIEAKAIVPHGEWENYLLENAGMGKRMCENCMSAFRRFGANDPEINRLNMSQVIALLPGSDEEIAKVSESGDLSKMSSREIQKAIRAAREEEQRKARESVAVMAEDKLRELARQKENFDRELKAKVEAARAEQSGEIEELKAKVEAAREERSGEIEAIRAEADEALAAKAGEIEALKNQLIESREAADHLRKAAEEAESRAREATQAAIDGAKDVSAQSSRLESEARKLREELADRDAMIQDLQEQYDSLRDEYTSAQSTAARGDAERTSADILSAEAVGDAVRIFIGQVGRIPFMHGTFSMMDEIEKDEYRACVAQIREWAEKSTAALETVSGIGGVVK